MNEFPYLSALTLVPIIGAVIVIGMKAENRSRARWLALGFSFVSLALAVSLWRRFDSASGILQFEERHTWIPTLGVQYHLAVDGLGLLMVLLAALITPMAMIASWKVEDRTRIYFALMLFLQAGLFGAFTALNFFHWFLFWELSLIPAFFLIKLWGGPSRNAAATQFFVYTMAGSVAMLLSFLAIFYVTGKFDFIDLAEVGRSGTLGSALAAKLGWFNLSAQEFSLLIFAGVFLGLAVKVPLIPFHTWLPSAYAEAPTGTTMLLTGVMSKMGVYGFLRILLPVFPEQMQSLMTLLLWLALATIVVSAGAAFAQRDLKRILAYSSINHLGYCLLGIFAVARFTGTETGSMIEKTAALNGVLLQMFNHGLTAATLFWFVSMLEKRTDGLRGLEDFGGLRKIAPVFCGLMGIALFSSLGLPGLNGFIGEFLIFKGVFPLASWAAAVAVLGLLITAVFILTILQRVFNGPLNTRWAGLPDLSISERVLVTPVLLLMLALGLYPQAILGVINSTVVQMVRQISS